MKIKINILENIRNLVTSCFKHSIEFLRLQILCIGFLFFIGIFNQNVFAVNSYNTVLKTHDNSDSVITVLFQSSYELYRSIRQSNGVYIDALAINVANKPAAIAANGVGLISLCIADSMYKKTGDAVNWESNAESLVLTTLQTFVNFKNNGNVNSAGMFHRYFDSKTGAISGSWSGEYSTIDNAIFAIGITFCKNYFSSNASIVSNANVLLGAMDYTKAITTGKQLYMILDQNGNGSAPLQPFNEYMIVAWLATKAGQTNPGLTKSITYWTTYFENPKSATLTHPVYSGYELISDGSFVSSFIPQFCYYLCHYFRDNADYMYYFSNAQKADSAWFANSGNPGVWGLGAGEIPNGGYSADKINDNKNLIVSPHIIAGFSPVFDSCKNKLVMMFNNGKGPSVYSLPGKPTKKVLWRYRLPKPLLRASYIQAIDFSSMLFGLAALPEFLGPDWFSRYNMPSGLKGADTASFAKTTIENKIAVYPNPFNQFISIRSSNSKLGKVSLFNMFNQQVFSVSEDLSNTKITLNSNLKSGFYFLEIKTNSGYERIKLLKE